MDRTPLPPDKDYVKLIRTAFASAVASPDPSTQTGVIIISPCLGGPVSWGYNRFPEGIEETEERLNDRPTKYKYIQHAERTAICNAARAGIALQNTTMVTSFGPYICNECAKDIIDSGIDHIVCSSFGETFDKKRWGDSVLLGFEMLKEAGVKVWEVHSDGSLSRINKL